MNFLIRFSLGNPRAITVLMLTIAIGGGAALGAIPADILPVYKAPAVQVLTFYGGMSATNVESAASRPGPSAGSGRPRARDARSPGPSSGPASSATTTRTTPTPARRSRR